MEEQNIKNGDKEAFTGRDRIAAGDNNNLHAHGWLRSMLQKVSDDVDSFFGTWLMYDILGIWNEFTLLMIYYLFFFVFFMGTESMTSSIANGTEVHKMQANNEMDIVDIFMNFIHNRIFYYLVQSCFSLVFAVLLEEPSSSEDTPGHSYIIPLIRELCEKFKLGINKIWKTVNADEQSVPRYRTFQSVLLILSIIVLHFIKGVFNESFEDDFRDYKTLLLSMLYKNTMRFISAKSFATIVIEIFYSNFKNPLKNLSISYIIFIFSMIPISANITLHSEDNSIVESTTFGILLLGVKSIFLCFLFDFGASSNNTGGLNNCLKIVIFVLFGVQVYYVEKFVQSLGFDEDVCEELISVDTIFSFFMAAVYTTRSDEEGSIMNKIIRIAKKVHATESPINIWTMILSGLITLGGTIYVVGIYAYSMNGEFDVDFFFPGLFITLIMLVNTAFSVLTYFFPAVNKVQGNEQVRLV